MTIYILLIITIILSLTVVILLNYIRKTKYEINKIVTILEDIDSGNIHRRIITNNNLLTTNLCYTINSIINKHENQLIKLKQSELSYRKLITSLSHDIKTPLASLVGYLDAINNKIVQDNEKDFYIQVALKKSLNLTTYINTLFEWLKLESGERIYNFKKVELCELTRNIITEGIPELEKNKFTYNIDIPENIRNYKMYSHELIIDEKNELLDNYSYTKVEANGMNIYVRSICQKNDTNEFIDVLKNYYNFNLETVDNSEE